MNCNLAMGKSPKNLSLFVEYSWRRDDSHSSGTDSIVAL